MLEKLQVLQISQTFNCFKAIFVAFQLPSIEKNKTKNQKKKEKTNIYFICFILYTFYFKILQKILKFY